MLATPPPSPRAGDTTFLAKLEALNPTGALATGNTHVSAPRFAVHKSQRLTCAKDILPIDSDLELCAIKATVHTRWDSISAAVYPIAQAVVSAYKSDLSMSADVPNCPMWHIIPAPSEGGAEFSTSSWFEAEPGRLHFFVFASATGHELEIHQQAWALRKTVGWSPKYAPVIVQVNADEGMRLTPPVLIEACRRLAARFLFARSFVVPGNLSNAFRMSSGSNEAVPILLPELFTGLETFWHQYNQRCCEHMAGVTSLYETGDLTKCIVGPGPLCHAAVRCVNSLRAGQLVAIDELFALGRCLVPNRAVREDVTALDDRAVVIVAEIAQQALIVGALMKVSVVYPLHDRTHVSTPTEEYAPQRAPACVLFDTANGECISFQKAMNLWLGPCYSSYPAVSAAFALDDFYGKLAIGIQRYLAWSSSVGKADLCASGLVAEMFTIYDVISR